MTTARNHDDRNFIASKIRADRSHSASRSQYTCDTDHNLLANVHMFLSGIVYKQILIILFVGNPHTLNN